MTALDDAHAAMERAPEDDTARLAYFARVAETELVLLLEKEATDAQAEPRIFDLETGPTVLAFDSDERLAEFADGAPYLALPGRRLAEMLAGQGLSLGLNIGVAPSAFLMPPEALSWLADTTAREPGQTQAKIVEVTPPGDLPEALVRAIDAKLARAAGLADKAYLARATYGDDRLGHVLAVVGTQEGAEARLAAELGEALTFSGLEAGELDLIFLSRDDPAAPRFARVGLQFDLPEPVSASPPKPPGVDPDEPPRLV